MTRNRKAPPIPVRPPFVLYCGLAAGGVMQLMIPVRLIPFSNEKIQILAGTILFAISLIIMTMAVTSFKRAGTNVRTDRASTGVVTGGIFNISRNPMYLSFCIFGLAFAVFFNSLWSLLGTVPFAAYIHHIVIPAEENYMAQQFGDSYLKYRERTGRWI